MSNTLKLWIAAVSGGVFGFLNMLTVATISSAAIDGPAQVDHMISQQWSQLILWAGGPAAAIGCGVFAAFLTGLGFFRVSTVVGIAGGATFGSAGILDRRHLWLLASKWLTATQ